jgi:hypothetical protein
VGEGWQTKRGREKVRERKGSRKRCSVRESERSREREIERKLVACNYFHLEGEVTRSLDVFSASQILTPCRARKGPSKLKKAPL